MKTAYINGILLDGTKEMTPQDGKVILTENQQIIGIEDQDSCDLTGMDVIDLGRQYVLPGLINLHAHLPGSGRPTKKPLNLAKICKLITAFGLGHVIGHRMIYRNILNGLMGGVTTMRGVGGIADFDSVVRNQINEGKRLGPRVLTSDSAISVPGGHMAGTFASIAHSPEEAAAMVDQIAKNRPDLIKLMITGGVMDTDDSGVPGALLMPEEYIKAACDRAHQLGYKVAAHCEGTAGVKAALKNGVDTIEHGATPDDEIMELFKQRGACAVLTISPALPYVMQLKGLFNLSESAVKNASVVCDGMIALANRCLAEGVPVGLGTDSSCSYVTQYGMWRELYYFAHYCHVSNAFALHTATQINARIAGIEEITGTIEVGKMADMIVVAQNPLEDLRALDHVTMVVMSGRCIDRPRCAKYPEVEQALDEVLTHLPDRF